MVQYFGDFSSDRPRDPTAHALVLSRGRSNVLVVPPPLKRVGDGRKPYNIMMFTVGYVTSKYYVLRCWLFSASSSVSWTLVAKKDTLTT